MNTEKTYAEENESKPFNWNAFLEQPDASKAEWDNAPRLASSWVTCACGNQCAIIPRNEMGAPTDTYLWRYGMDFYRSIRDWDKKAARKVLSKIEHRSTVLIAKIEKKEAQV